MVNLFNDLSSKKLEHFELDLGEIIFEKKYMNKLKFSINRKTLTKLRSTIAHLR